MKVVVLDEMKKRNKQIAELLEEKGCDVVACTATGDFMNSVETSVPDKILMEVESWQHGKAIYNYFKFSRKIGEIPVFFYNAPENFSNIQDRSQNQNDKVFTKHTEIDEIVSNV